MAYEWIVEGLEETWAATSRILRGLSPGQLDASTSCPGWTVRDIVSHLIGFERMIQGEPVPPAPEGVGDHVKNPIGELNELFVAARRQRNVSDLLAEFNEVTARSLINLRTKSASAWEVVGWSPEGDVPHHRFQETRLLDSWIHLQDLRDALLEPQDDHGVGEDVVINRFEAALPFVIGAKVRPPEGTTVRFNLVGRLARTVTVEVVASRARVLQNLADAPDVEITTPVALFWRRAAGRISSQALLQASATHVEGDRELARRIAEELTIMI